ncbi:BTAD domain-containing putative transcriptional regulator [Streptomyces sp. NPDC051172]|uniref:AfsR/SARP family transcriptional regulator n=1 Tax=Streptomyces sp. NPDC051172 TaxID=3155796 RepID=UPI00343D0063
MGTAEHTLNSQNPKLIFNILGPLTGWAGEERVFFGGQVQKRLMAMLLLDPGRVVPIHRLIEAVWEQDPPATAAHQVRKAVAELRKRIPNGPAVILTDGPGYQVDPAECRLDLLEFDERTQAAGRALREGDRAAAVDELRAALSLWKGSVLSGEGGPVVEGAATALEERRLAATEQLFELRLALGESSELVSELHALIAEYPLRETLRGHLMLALYRSGRQAEALEEYGRVREELRDRLGIDPGPRLVELHTGILQSRPELNAPEPSAPSEVTGTRHPASRSLPLCTLPPSLSDFTGRERELAELLDYVEAGTPFGDPSPRIVAIDGMGGTGKTSLAVRAAHLLVERFSDGQVSIDLRGFTPGEGPLSPATALDVLLRYLGTPGDRIPDDLEGRTGLWRSLLADRRLLLLLDNVVSAEQIQPLLPAAPGCLVLTTSRSRLMDLDGAKWISIGLMPPEESAALVAETLSPERVNAEPEAAAELAELCGHLPLALRLATARLRNRPRWTIRYLVKRLRDENRRLDELRSGERSVAATLHLSYLAMSEQHRTAFLVLGLHPGAVFDVHSAAALLGIHPLDAEDTLESLLDAHLLQQPATDLYTFHDLVRSFAQGMGDATGELDEAAAVERLLRYYVTTTDAACDVLFPGRTYRRTGLPPYEGERPPIRDAEQATAWSAREHGGLLAAVALAERRGYDRHTVCLTRNLNFLLHARGQFDDLWNLGHFAVSAARRLDEPALLCVALSNLGSACWKLGRIEEGLKVAVEGRDIATGLGDRHTEAHGESIIGLLLTELGKYREALPLLKRSIALARELGTPRAEAESLATLSTLYERWGRYPEAADAARRAIEASRSIGYRDNEVMALTDLAFAHVGLGEYTDAHHRLMEARSLCDESTSPGDVGLVLALSAKVEHHLGEEAQAHELADRALLLARTSTAQVRLAKVQNLVGSLHEAWRDHATARKLYAQAHTTAAAIRFRSEEAFALLGLARVTEALGEESVAAEHRSAAEKLFDLMELPQHARS